MSEPTPVHTAEHCTGFRMSGIFESSIGRGIRVTNSAVSTLAISAYAHHSLEPEEMRGTLTIGYASIYSHYYRGPVALIDAKWWSDLQGLSLS